MPLGPPMVNPGPMAPAQGAAVPGPVATGGPVSVGGPAMRPPMGGADPNAGGPMHTMGSPGFVGNGMRSMGPGRPVHATPHGMIPWGNGGRY